jgi:hypothetical protein
MSYARADGYNVAGWIETYTGRMVTPLQPDPGTLSITDIAYALANKCRYSGHTAMFYSVAEHSVLMALFALNRGDRNCARWALLHDAVEAYIPDVPRPLKPGLAGWAELEERVEDAVIEHFGFGTAIPRLTDETRALVKSLDTRILLREAKVLLLSGGLNWRIEGDPLPVTIHGWRPAQARAEFLSLFDDLLPEYREPLIEPWFNACVDQSTAYVVAS